MLPLLLSAARLCGALAFTKLLDGNKRPGTVALYPLGYWPSAILPLQARIDGPGENRTHDLPLRRRSNPVLHHVQHFRVCKGKPRNPQFFSRGEIFRREFYLQPVRTTGRPGANPLTGCDSRRTASCREENRTENRAVSPHRVTDEVTRLCAIPASCSGGNEQFAFFSYCPCGQARIELASPLRS